MKRGQYMTDRSVPSSTEILLSLRPQLDRAEHLLRQARPRGTKEDTAVRVALFGLARLGEALEGIVQQLDDDDLAEQVAVYEIITEQCAEITGHSVRFVLPALLRLCGESNPLVVANLESPDPAVIADLEKTLVRVTATYSVEGKRRGERAVEIFYGAGPGGVHSRRVLEEMDWERLPEDVREQLLGHGRQQVVFTVYSGVK